MLTRVARAAVDGSPLDLQVIAPSVDEWRGVVEAADINHLAPLAHAFLRRNRAIVPDWTMQALGALVLRQRAWHRERSFALTELLQTFERLAIDVLVLKGAALAWMSYPSPALRPWATSTSSLGQPRPRPPKPPSICRGFRSRSVRGSSAGPRIIISRWSAEAAAGSKSASRSTSMRSRAIPSPESPWIT